MTSDWYRSPGWSDAERDDFEKRLRRARSTNRAQYLRIKALAVETQNPLAAERLLHRVVEDYTDDWPQVASALERLGDLRQRCGDQTAAEAHYRATLNTSPTLSGTSGEVHLKLGELLLDRDGPSDEVFEMLEAAKPHLSLNTSVFRWHTLAVRAATALGDTAASAASAAIALDLLNAAPQFPRHPTVGLAKATPETTSMLRGFAAGHIGARRRRLRWSRSR